MAIDRAATIGRLDQILAGARSTDGGWPYYAGKSSRIEPTAWVLLALGGRHDATEPLRLLASRQRADGLLVDAPQAPPNLNANGLAACALAAAPARDGTMLARLLDGLIAIKGAAVDEGDSRQDNRLQAWPWMPDTFSWVEPTCWCVLALKIMRSRLGTKGDARIAEADKLLINRSCQDGGWNYGNASAVGQDLRPYVPTSALGLIALQDRRADPVVRRSLDYLVQARAAEPSAMALALTSVSLRLYDRPASEIDDADERLAADLPRAESVGNLQALAMALYALSADRHQVSALRV